MIDSIHQVRSASIVPYLECNDRNICETCGDHHGSGCPCPMRYLAVLIVDAVEAVDRRHHSQEVTA